MTIVVGKSEAPFSIATTSRGRRGRYSFPWITPLTLDPLIIMLSDKPGGIKYHSLSLRYDTTWNGTPVSRTIGENPNHCANGACIYIYIYIYIYAYIGVPFCQLLRTSMMRLNVNLLREV